MKNEVAYLALLFVIAFNAACGSSDKPSASGGDGGASENAGSGGAAAGASGGTSAGRAGAGVPDGISDAGPATTNIQDRACTAGSKLPAISEGDISRPNRTTGTSGSFIDECEVSGVLTEYVCEAPFTCNGQCAYVETGDVVPLKTQCAVGCRNGACLND